MASYGAYDDWSDEKARQVNWVFDCLSRRVKLTPSKTRGEVQRIIDSFAGYIEMSNPPSPNDAIDDWEEFHRFMEGTRANSAAVRRQHPWQIWLSKDPQHNYRTGIDGCISTVLSEEGAGTIHRYMGIPDSIAVKLMPATQGNVRYFLGSMKIKDIDAICSVPSMPIETDAAASALRASDPNKGKDEWQRRMDKDRILGIRSWADSNADNHILNSIMLYIPPDAFKNGVELNDSGEFSIEFSFLQNLSGSLYCDWEERYDTHKNASLLTDRRPIWILDGQHRTRGLAISERGSEMEVPITVMTAEGGVDLTGAAKLFTEINTLGEDLKDHLKYFLSNRFKIPGSGLFDFGDPRESGIDKNTKAKRRAHREAYMLAYWLCATNPGDSMYGTIQMMPENSASKTHTTINVWMQYVSRWFVSSSRAGAPAPYPSNSMKRSDYISEVSNYFEAWQANSNHGLWRNQPYTPRWKSDRGSHQALLEGDTQFKSLLILYPWLIKWMVDNHPKQSRPFSQGLFEEVLEPLRFADWKDKRVLSVFKVGGEPSRTYIQNWIERAISGRESHSEDIVMSNDPDLAKESGKALLSKPYEVVLLNKPRWPTPNRALVARIPRPKNTRKSERILIGLRATTDDGNSLECDLHWNQTKDEFEITIDHSLNITKSKLIDIEGDWENPCGSTSFLYTINR